MRIVLVDEETTGECEEVDMSPGARIQEMHVAMFDRQAAKEDGGRLGLTNVTQQPGIVTFTRSGIGDVGEIDLQFIIDPLIIVLIQLTTIHEENIACLLDPGSGISLRRQQECTKTRT